jgi:signal transduction histidine kinase
MLQSLTAILSEMLAALEAALTTERQTAEAQKRFVADAAHELRDPAGERLLPHRSPASHASTLSLSHARGSSRAPDRAERAVGRIAAREVRRLIAPLREEPRRVVRPLADAAVHREWTIARQLRVPRA